MSLTIQTVTLSSDRHYGRNIPSQALGHALTALPVVVRQSVSMAFRGRSGVRGVRPGWLRAATDLRFIDHDGDDATRLVFEVPTLGEAAGELYRQHMIRWPRTQHRESGKHGLFNSRIVGDQNLPDYAS